MDVKTGKWTAVDFGIGGGVDSYFEYLVKGGIMFNIPELIDMFHGWYTINLFILTVSCFFLFISLQFLEHHPRSRLKQLLNTLATVCMCRINLRISNNNPTVC